MNKFYKSKDGATAIEFTILFPLFAAVLFALFELGALFLRFNQLDQAVDKVSRVMRVNTSVRYTEPTIRRLICSELQISQKCEDRLSVELVRFSSFAQSGPKNTCAATGQAIRTPGSFSRGAKSEVMIMRVCMSFDIITPMIGVALKLGADQSGRYVAVSSTLFANEP
ncbi:pilus assembly protein [Peteryoungia desertarenae]|uniref:Pilus assembly protein n=1 Tax=Peteryoungia desertarenae TaxID=1813451 RepID=A0ABX6QJR4_9HYPH|nr:TadE/TadG family type IV pilus assembly protein [Peteryoungia desertarenae]QLF68527.1 pilus assembly protein [Peteryoungia desertarenae]